MTVARGMLGNGLMSRVWSLVMLALLVLVPSSARAETRKRVVVLALEGSKSDAVRTELVRLIKKHHAVIRKGLWERAARSGAKVDATSVKKLARAMDVDAIVSGQVEKQRSGYRVRLQLRSGHTGEVIGQLRTAFDGESFDTRARAELRDDLIHAIASHRPTKAKSARRR
jgi:TolB-like protein